MDGLLRAWDAPLFAHRRPMRQDPPNAPRDSRSPATPPNGTDAKRAGIRRLDCGEGDELTTPVRAQPSADPPAADDAADTRPRGVRRSDARLRPR